MKFSSRSNLPPAIPFEASVFVVKHDLTCTDTTGWPGFEELERSAIEALVQEESLRYVPESRGSMNARVSLSKFQPPRDADRWVLTASTSEAYSILFQLLCDPGSKVATPTPGYPLIDELGRFHDVGTAKIPLRLTDNSWALDLGWTERRLREGVKALILIQPANPTGWVLSLDERDQILALCSRYDVPLISDEVFEAWAPEGFQSLADQDEVLCFTLGGLSKLLGLPHLKLGWIRVSGPSTRVLEALARLDLLNDALLSAGTPVQAALTNLLGRKTDFQGKIQARLTQNRKQWNASGNQFPPYVQRLEASGGWFGIVLWSAPWSEEAVCGELLQRGVKVQPGYLFDLPRAGLVVSLLTESSTLLHGLSVLVDLFISLEH